MIKLNGVLLDETLLEAYKKVYKGKLPYMIISITEDKNKVY